MARDDVSACIPLASAGRRARLEAGRVALCLAVARRRGDVGLARALDDDRTVLAELLIEEGPAP